MAWGAALRLEKAKGLIESAAKVEDKRPEAR
jgi:hypothetical protein